MARIIASDQWRNGKNFHSSEAQRIAKPFCGFCANVDSVWRKCAAQLFPSMCLQPEDSTSTETAPTEMT